jgi:NAD(P)-dependent dehydrogenase (short-subunit alcohol dehydrogenase family)
MGEIRGSRAVVIGGSQGMGLAMARALVAGGAEVVVTGRDEKRLEEARAVLGPSAHVVRSDVTSAADRDALAGRVGELLGGGVDALFVNQGYSRLGSFEEVTEEDYDRHFDVNTKGAFFTVQRLAPKLADGGAIVFTTSVADTGANPGMMAYAGAKAAVWSFAQGFAAELLPRRIRVNAVAPGFTDTPTMGVDASEEQKAEFMRIGDEVTPMKRHATVDEVAATALYLAYDATFSTAVRVPVDGGLEALSTAF